MNRLLAGSMYFGRTDMYARTYIRRISLPLLWLFVLGVTPAWSVGTPTLVYPATGATNILLNDSLKWNADSNAQTCRVQVSTSATFTSAATSGFSTLRTFTTALVPPAVLAPGSGATDQLVTPALRWSTVAGATSYLVQLAKSTTFKPLLAQVVTTADSVVQGPLGNDSIYYWRVRARNSGWVTDWSPVRSATVMSQPVVYDLFQNYPNPCNPATVIRYDVPVESQVSLILYDLLGQQVRTLVDAVLKPVRYEDLVDMKNLPSGMFIYRLITRPVPGPNQPLMDPISFTKKLMIVR